MATEPAFTAVKLAGAAYLVFLGIQSLRAALRADGRRASAEEPGPRLATAPADSCAKGT